MTQAFKFKEYDLEGWETLEAMAAAPRLNQWMYQTISSKLKGNVLEIGSGLGNLSACFLDDQRPLYLTDLRDNYLTYLKDQFHGNDHVLGIGQMDLVHPDFDAVYADKLNSFDGLFALNVVEHIKNEITSDIFSAWVVFSETKINRAQLIDSDQNKLCPTVESISK